MSVLGPIEMAMPKKQAEVRLLGLADPIARHLLRLLAFDADETTRGHWKKELDT
jgi:hypothetical protein